MSIRVISGKVWDGKNMFAPGDLIKHLSEDDEDALVEAEKAEYVFDDKAEDDVGFDEEDDEDDEKLPKSDVINSGEGTPPENEVPPEVDTENLEEGKNPPDETQESEIINDASLNIEFNADEYVQAGNAPETHKKNRK